MGTVIRRKVTSVVGVGVDVGSAGGIPSLRYCVRSGGAGVGRDPDEGEEEGDEAGDINDGVGGFLVVQRGVAWFSGCFPSAPSRYLSLPRLTPLSSMPSETSARRRSDDRLLSLFACMINPSEFLAFRCIGDCIDGDEDVEEDDRAGARAPSRPAGLAPACTGSSESKPRLTRADRTLGMDFARSGCLVEYFVVHVDVEDDERDSSHLSISWRSGGRCRARTSIEWGDQAETPS